MANRSYEHDLRQIDRDVATLFSFVARAITSAVGSIVDNDRSAGQAVVDRDDLIDSLYREIEDLAQRQFALHAPAALDMKYLVAVLRFVPELERSGDLAEHVGRRAGFGILESVSPRIKSMTARMGNLVVLMWTQLVQAYESRDTDLEARFRLLDDEVDDLHVGLIAEIVESDGIATATAIELALTCRFLERLGDHAVNVARRLGTLTVGVPQRDHEPN